MKKKPENPQAFPQSCDQHGYEVAYTSGMTLRDYFAAAALTGIWACPTDLIDNAAGGVKIIGEKKIAKLAYAQADAMLEVREK